MNLTIKLRGDTEANWASTNPVLAEREVALSTDTLNFKVGDGSTAWASLDNWFDRIGAIDILTALGGGVSFDSTGKSTDQEKDFWLGVAMSAAALVIQSRTNGAYTSVLFWLDWFGNLAISGGTPTSRLEIGAGAITLSEMTPPSAPANDKARIYAKDNGSGKTQLCVKFAGGSEIVLATQP